MFRLQDNVPEVYANESRDFQLFCRLYDSTFGSTKYSIDTLSTASDTNACNERLLELLKTKLGVFSETHIAADDLRVILKGFPTIVRYKGSRKAVYYLLNIFLKLTKVSNATAIIDTDLFEGTTDLTTGCIVHNDGFVLKINFPVVIKYEGLLRELLRYVLPAGYEIQFVIEPDVNTTTTLYAKSTVDIVTSSDASEQFLSNVVGNKDYHPQSGNNIIANADASINTVGLTIVQKISDIKETQDENN